MKLMSKLRLRAKLMLAFVLLALIVLMVSLLASHSLSQSNARFADYLEGVGQREQLAFEIRGAAMRRAIAARNLVLLANPGERDAEKAMVMHAHGHMQQGLVKLREALARAGDLGPQDRALVAEIARVQSLYGPVAEDIAIAAMKPWPRGTPNAGRCWRRC